MNGTGGAAPGERFMWERPWAGAALGAAFAFCQDQSQQRDLGQRGHGGDPSRLPFPSTAPQHRGSFPGSGGCWLQATAFPAIGRDFPPLVLFQPTLHLNLFVENFVVWDMRGHGGRYHKAAGQEEPTYSF